MGDHAHRRRRCYELEHAVPWDELIERLRTRHPPVNDAP